MARSIFIFLTVLAAAVAMETAPERELERLVRDEGGVLMPMFPNHFHALRDNVKHGDQVTGNWQLNGNRCNERWWLA